jgi:O-antigen ligase
MVLNYAMQMGVFAAAVLVLLFVALWWPFARLTASTEIAALAGVCGLMLVTGFFLRNMVDDFFMRHNVLLFAAVVGMFLGVGLRAASGRSD